MRNAVANGCTSRNPVAAIKPGEVVKPRTRRKCPGIDQNELSTLLKVIDSSLGAEHTRLALQFRTLTCVRPSELIGTRWSEVDIKETRRVIPAERTSAWIRATRR
jgi:integrase